MTIMGLCERGHGQSFIDSRRLINGEGSDDRCAYSDGLGDEPCLLKINYRWKLIKVSRHA